MLRQKSKWNKLGLRFTVMTGGCLSRSTTTTIKSKTSRNHVGDIQHQQQEMLSRRAAAQSLHSNEPDISALLGLFQSFIVLTRFYIGKHTRKQNFPDDIAVLQWSIDLEAYLGRLLMITESLPKYVYNIWREEIHILVFPCGSTEDGSQRRTKHFQRPFFRDRGGIDASKHLLIWALEVALKDDSTHSAGKRTTAVNEEQHVKQKNCEEKCT